MRKHRYIPIRHGPFKDSAPRLEHYHPDDVAHCRRAMNRRDARNWLILALILLVATVAFLFRRPPMPRFTFPSERYYPKSVPHDR